MDDMPKDPFNSETPDLGLWAVNCRGMYTSLIAAGFNNIEALEITIRCMQAMLTKAVGLWDGIGHINMYGSCKHMLSGLLRVKCFALPAVNAVKPGGSCHLRRRWYENSCGSFGQVVCGYYPGV